MKGLSRGLVVAASAYAMSCDPGPRVTAERESDGAVLQEDQNIRDMAGDTQRVVADAMMANHDLGNFHPLPDSEVTAVADAMMANHDLGNFHPLPDSEVTAVDDATGDAAIDSFTEDAGFVAPETPTPEWVMQELRTHCERIIENAVSVDIPNLPDTQKWTASTQQEWIPDVGNRMWECKEMGTHNVLIDGYPYWDYGHGGNYFSLCVRRIEAQDNTPGPFPNILCVNGTQNYEVGVHMRDVGFRVTHYGENGNYLGKQWRYFSYNDGGCFSEVLENGALVENREDPSVCSGQIDAVFSLASGMTALAEQQCETLQEPGQPIENCSAEPRPRAE